MRIQIRCGVRAWLLFAFSVTVLMSTAADIVIAIMASPAPTPQRVQQPFADLVAVARAEGDHHVARRSLLRQC